MAKSAAKALAHWLMACHLDQSLAPGAAGCHLASMVLRANVP